jgi:RNA 3'-terminal phosphate cyclase (ATP)
MLEVDGSEGGGQLLRTALSLAALTGESLEMTGIRGARSNPGLRPQHLAAVRLLAAVCDAEVSEVAAGTEELTFEPGAVSPGRYDVDVGTAGSVTLLFDAVLPLATVLDAPLVVSATGGTAVKWSPAMAYYRRVKLPLLRRHGLQAAVDVERPGFYPTGGGLARLHLAPSQLDPFELRDRGELTGARVDSLEAETLTDQAVAARQAEAVVEPLENAGISVLERRERTAVTDSPGSAVAVRLDYDNAIVGVDELGERGRPAEDVGRAAAEAALAFDDGDGAVDRHAADQLLVFLARAGGAVRIPAVTEHVASHRRLLEAFGFEVALDREAAGAEARAPGTER